MIRLFTAVLFLTTFTLSSYCQTDDYRFWISKMTGGNGYGKISSVNTDGTGYDDGLTLEGPPDGSSPNGLLLASDNKVYGTTTNGGMYDAGVFFRMDLDGSGFSVLHHFTVATQNPLKLAESNSGTLFGICQGSGPSIPGIIFSWSKIDASFNIVHEFTNALEGTNPTDLIKASNGNLYVVCSRQGSNNSAGALSRFNPADNDFEKLKDLPSVYLGKLTEGSDGSLYGIIYYRDISPNGEIYRINLDGSGYETILDFSSANAKSPAHKVLEGSDGYLYGTATLTTFAEVIYKVKKDGTDFTPIYTFSADGYSVGTAGLTLGADNFLYGFTYSGAANNLGSFYKIKIDGSGFEKLKDLDSDFPSSGISFENAGSFYGVSGQGASGNGVVRKFVPHGTSIKLKEFPEPINYASNILYSKSKELYVRGSAGGVKGLGGVLKMQTDGSTTTEVIYENGSTDNANFQYNFAEDESGNLYGFVEGNRIAKLSADNTISIIHQFPNNLFTWHTTASLFYASDGFLYGLTVGGGDHDKGTFYRLRTDGTEFSIQHSFQESPYSRQPVQFEADRYLYGVCNGGVNGKGSIYRFNLDTQAFERIFDLTSNFGTTLFEYVKIIKGSDNVIYGMATSGGSYGNGMLFRLNMDGTGFQELYTFFSNGGTQEYLPRTILESPDGKLYGITALGGSQNKGLIFRIEKDGSDYQRIFELPNEPRIIFLAEVELFLLPKKEHQITFNLSDQTVAFGEGPIGLVASSSAGLPISFESSDPSIAKVEGSTLVILKPGTVTLTAQQVSNNFYTRAVVTQTLTISKGEQTITFNSLPSRTIEDGEFELTATSSAGLPLSYSTPDDNIAISGTKVTILGAGLATIIASQDGDANYHPASRVEHDICINPAKPVITDERTSVTSIELTSSNDIGNQWFLNGNEIEGATGKNLTITVDGAYSVRSKVETCQSMMSDEYVSIVTGVEHLESGISIYPNPVGGNLVVEVANENDFSLDIIDISGSTLLHSKTLNSRAAFDVGHLREGVYFVRLKVKDNLYFKKIVKKGMP